MLTTFCFQVIKKTPALCGWAKQRNTFFYLWPARCGRTVGLPWWCWLLIHIHHLLQFVAEFSLRLFSLLLCFSTLSHLLMTFFSNVIVNKIRQDLLLDQICFLSHSCRLAHWRSTDPVTELMEPMEFNWVFSLPVIVSIMSCSHLGLCYITCTCAHSSVWVNHWRICKCLKCVTTTFVWGRAAL